jgi:hypothetical protein
MACSGILEKVGTACLFLYRYVLFLRLAPVAGCAPVLCWQGFVETHQLKLDELLDPIDSFKTFNEFFYRTCNFFRLVAR